MFLLSLYGLSHTHLQSWSYKCMSLCLAIMWIPQTWTQILQAQVFIAKEGLYPLSRLSIPCNFCPWHLTAQIVPTQSSLLPHFCVLRHYLPCPPVLLGEVSQGSQQASAKINSCPRHAYSCLSHSLSYRRYTIQPPPNFVLRVIFPKTLSILASPVITDTDWKALCLIYNLS